MISYVVTFDILKGLNPTTMDAVSRVSCLPGTRRDLLKEIIDRLMTPSDKNVLWLHGAAGLGKSTLANSVAEYFGGLRRQGAFLFFDRNTPNESAPTAVIRTLAYQLAEHNPAIKSALAMAIEADPKLQLAPISTQFGALLMEPLLAASAEITGPVIIVFDALDECGDASSRRALLSLLSQELGKLPRQFRFLITSRPDVDIASAFNAAPHVCGIDLSTSESADDVLLYIKHEMNQIYLSKRVPYELPLDWPGVLAVESLGTFTAGLFIWAATAMKYILDGDPVRRLSALLEKQGQVFTLGKLYKTALLSVSHGEPEESPDTLQQVLGIIVVSQIPLTDTVISELLGFTDSGRQCRIILRRLGCVISWSEGQPARTLHKSFPDYLTNPADCSSDPWFIKTREHHHALAIACFQLMNSQLHFNICNLPTSHAFNKEISDLPTLIQSCIPESLSYACRYWMVHLTQSPEGDSEITRLILEFFQEHFLHWLEVLSLIKDVSMAVMALNAVVIYVAVSNIHNERVRFS